MKIKKHRDIMRERGYLTVTEAALRAGLHRDIIYAAVRGGRIAHEESAGHSYIKISDLDRWLGVAAQNAVFE